MKKAFRKVLIALVPLIIFVVVLETSARLLTPKSKSQRVNKDFEVRGPWKGLPFQIPIQDGRLGLEENGKVLYDTTFSLDQWKRRKSFSHHGHPDKFYLFVGCSFTFGSGVEDDETLPSEVQKLTEGFRVYNYGVSGSTPLEVLARLQSIEKEELTEKSGRVIYDFIGAHLVRMFWRPYFTGLWGYKKPYLYLAAEKVRSARTYSEVFPVKTLFYKTLVSLQTYKLTRNIFGETYSENELKDFAGVITLMNKEALRLSGRPLIFLALPSPNLDDHVISVVQKTGVEVIDLSSVDLDKLTNGKAYIPIDGHPTRDGYSAMARLFLNALKSRE